MDSSKLLSQIELQENDLELLENGGEEDEKQDLAALPVVAVIGRPNVGKSTLVNRILGRRAAVVQDKPGVTRDRVRYQAQWAGKDFLLMDTGGWELGVQGLDQMVAAQAEVSLQYADAVLFVADARWERPKPICRLHGYCKNAVDRLFWWLIKWIQSA